MTGFLPFLADASDKSFWMPPQASDFAENVDGLFYFILTLCIFFFVLLMALTGYFAWKYKASPTNRRSSPLSHNFRLEFLWSAIPTVLLIVIFAWGFRDFTALSATPADAVELRVVGQRWSWKIGYPKLDRECNSEALPNGDNVVNFYLPVNRPFTVQMSSEDVLHSFWIPAFRVKRDVIPNRYTGFTVTPTQTGQFPMYCAEYCGDSHSHMKGIVNVLSAEEWDAWLKGDQCKALSPSDPQYKEKLFAKQGCNACHGVKPEQGVIVGPNLFGLVAKGNEKTTAGDVAVDDNYLRESIEYPEKKIVEGFQGKNMPSFKGRLKEEEMSALIDYIKSLK